MNRGGRTMSFFCNPITLKISALVDDHLLVQKLAALTTTACVDGFADIYPCNNVDLESFMPLGFAFL